MTKNNLKKKMTKNDKHRQTHDKQNVNKMTKNDTKCQTNDKNDKK